MLKMLMIFIMVAIIAFSIGFNVARYPIVWEMVGPSINDKESDSSVAIAQSQNPKTDAQISTANPEKDSQGILNNTPNQAPLNVDSAQFQDERRGQNQDSATGSYPQTVESTQSASRLVPVPANLFIGNNNNQPQSDQSIVRRLPQVNQNGAISAGRYAAEYPQTPIPIYPSTGIK